MSALRDPLLRGLLLVSACIATEATSQTSCSYSVSPLLNYGTITGLPTPQLDVSATITVTCQSLVSVNHRVCLSLPAGSGGISVSDRRLVNGPHTLQYQLYTNPARTTVWGEFGGAGTMVAVDFPDLDLGIPVDQQATVHARLFAGQSGMAVGLYQSNLTPITARGTDHVLTAPSCESVTGNPQILPPVPIQATIAPVCQIVASPLSFGTVTGLGGHSASSNLSVTCTLGAAYAISLDGGSVSGDVNARRMRLGAGPNTIDYQLYRDAGLTAVWGNSPGLQALGTGTGSGQSVPVFGWVPPQGAKPIGTYQDTVTATIHY